MDSSGGNQYADSIRFIRELRRLIPPSRQREGRKPRAPEPVPSESLTDLQGYIEEATLLPSTRQPVSCFGALEAAMRGENFQPAVMAHSLVPRIPHHYIDQYKKSVYGGHFVGQDGSRFVTSCQDRVIRVYNTGRSECRSAWKLTHAIEALGVRWTITDFDVSPDGRWLAYASLNRFVHLVDLDNTRKEQIVLDFGYGVGPSTNIWSLKWSHDGNEIIVGTGTGGMKFNGNVMMYDVQLGKMVDVIIAHDEDVNSVCFMRTGERNLILSASDDALVKLWDRRDASMRSIDNLHRPCALFVGHQLGLTFVSTKDDGRFLLSNGKDQYIKLWDARRCTSVSDVGQVRMPPRDPTFDYRVRNCPRVLPAGREFRDDAVMTYAGGHETLQTLIRAYFSPMHSTGQKYIYCGSSDGKCVIYDVMTGKQVRTLVGHGSPVRDVSWHPLGCFLTTSSWDGKVLLWGRDSDMNDEEKEVIGRSTGTLRCRTSSWFCET